LLKNFPITAILLLSFLLNAQNSTSNKALEVIAGTASELAPLAAAQPRAVTALISGQPAPFSLPSVSNPTLFTGDYGFSINVPSGATKLTIETRSANDVDLAVRFGLEPAIEAGQPNSVRADFRAITDYGNETIVITPSSSPALGVGTYYIGLMVFYRGVSMSGQVIATVEGGSSPGTGGAPLTVTVSDSSSSSRPAAGAGRVDLYTETGTQLVARATTDASRRVSFPNLSNGRYRIQVYNTAGFNGSVEYWGSQTFSVNGSSSVDFRRSLPVVNRVTLSSGRTTLTESSKVKVGDEISAEFQITGGGASASVGLVVDRDAKVPFDITTDCGSSTSRVACTFKVPSAGTYQFGYTVTSGGQTTDSGGWLGAFTADGTEEIVVSGVFDAVSGRRDHVSAGALATIQASGLAPQLRGCLTSQWLAGPLPVSLGDVSVQLRTLGGSSHDAPIQNVCNTDGRESVTFLIPAEIKDANPSVSISRGGVTALISKLPLLAASPSLVEWSPPRSRTISFVLRPDGTPVTAENPLRRGERGKLFAGGLGAVGPTVPTNAFGPIDTAARVVLPVIVGLNNGGVPVISAAYSGDRIGIYEVVFEVPQEVPAGSAIVLSIAVETGSGTVFSLGSSLPIR
jgi:uncharacterized protein (TIGR03437 family)